MVDATSSEAILQDPVWGRDGLREKIKKNAADLRELRRKMGLPDKEDNGSGGK